LRISGRAPWDDNTEAGAQRAEAEHRLWIATQPPCRKPKFRPTNRKSALLHVLHVQQGGTAEGMPPLPTAPAAPAVPTLRAFLPTYLAHAQATNTASTFDAKKERVEDYLLKVEIDGWPIADRRLDQFNNALMEDFKLHLKDMRCTRYNAGVRTLKPSTVNQIINVLTNCLRYAKFREVIATLPQVQRLPRPKKRMKISNFITPDEVHRLLSFAEGMWLALFSTAYYTGMRRGEIRGVGRSQVNVPARTLTVDRAFVRGEFKSPKDGESRVINLCRDAVEILTWWLPQIPAGQDLLFAENGRPITEGKVQSQLTRLCRLAGLRIISLRTLRHSFATHLAKRGNLEEVQGFLGHSEIEMTMNYVHRTDDAARRTIEHLNRARGKRRVLGAAPARPKGRVKTLRELHAERSTSLGGAVVQQGLQKPAPAVVTN